MTEYYANACIICSATQSLKRCTRCQMISYCGQLHQKEQWLKHKKLCKIISNMMKERGVSHIFEKLRGTDLEKRENEALCRGRNEAEKTFRDEWSLHLQISKILFRLLRIEAGLIDKLSRLSISEFLQISSHQSYPRQSLRPNEEMLWRLPQSRKLRHHDTADSHVDHPPFHKNSQMFKSTGFHARLLIWLRSA